MLEIKKFEFNPFQENTYLIFDVHSKESAIIDPGCYDAEEEKELNDFIESNHLFIKYVINTHCHMDHIFGNAFVVEKYNAELLIPAKDEFLLDIQIEQSESFGIKIKKSPPPERYIEESDTLRLGNIEGVFFETPGHTPGEVCLFFKNEKVCFSGDVLFLESIGRTDLWGGDKKQLIDSIKNKLLKLPDDTIVFPGHGEKTTIGYEKLNNPFL